MQIASRILSKSDLGSLSDSELNAIIEVVLKEVSNLREGDEPLIRFWGGLLEVMGQEWKKRRDEVKELERLYFKI